MSEADILDALRQIAQDKLKVDRPLNGDLASATYYATTLGPRDRDDVIGAY